MFTTSLDNFKIQQEELHRQAAKFRLARPFVKSQSWTSRVYSAVGRTLIASGQELMKQAQVAR
jgi:hypothetical protein